MSGTGSAGDPFVPVLILDPATDNAAECRDDGLYVRALDHAFINRVAGNYTVNGTAWANLDTGLDQVLTDVLAGDVVEVGAIGGWFNEATDGYMNVGSVIAGAMVNHWAPSGAGDAGVLAWRSFASRHDDFGGSVMKTIVAGDLSAGSLTLRLRVRTSTATNKTFLADATRQFQWWAKNTGPPLP